MVLFARLIVSNYVDLLCTLTVSFSGNEKRKTVELYEMRAAHWSTIHDFSCGLVFHLSWHIQYLQICGVCKVGQKLRKIYRRFATDSLNVDSPVNYWWHKYSRPNGSAHGLMIQSCDARDIQEIVSWPMTQSCDICDVQQSISLSTFYLSWCPRYWDIQISLYTFTCYIKIWVSLFRVVFATLEMGWYRTYVYAVWVAGRWSKYST